MGYATRAAETDVRLTSSTRRPVVALYGHPWPAALAQPVMNHVFVLELNAAWAAILVVCWLGWLLLRQNGRILLRLEALEKRLEQSGNGDESEAGMLPIGSPAPDFELSDLAGDRKSLANFLGQPVLLIFFDPACGFCRELLPKLVKICRVPRQVERDASLVTATEATEPGQSAVPDGGVQNISASSPDSLPPRVLIVSTGDVEANRQLLDEHKLTCPVLLQKEAEVATSYQANGTPTGYLVDASGKIASELAMGGEALLKLAGRKAESGKLKPEIDQGLSEPVTGNGNDRENRFSKRSLARSKLKRDGLKAGTFAPEFRLPLLDGGEISLADLRGRPVFLVFSSPHCGPCNTLAPKLEKFHRKHSELEVVMISRGEPGENREKVKEHGLTFPVVLQKQWEISRQYAIFASPVAYLIDGGGVITADVAVGVDPILDLMTRVGPLLRQNETTQKPPLLKRMARWPVAVTAAALQWLMVRLTLAKSRIDTFELKTGSVLGMVLTTRAEFLFASVTTVSSRKRAAIFTLHRSPCARLPRSA